MINSQNKKAFLELLQKAGIPFIEMKVFGTLRLNIIIEAKGYKASQEWIALLNQVVKNPSIKLLETSKEYLNGHDGDSSLLKHTYKIWRVYCVV